MSIATSMKSLVDGINTSIKERETFVQDLVKDVHALKARYQKELDDLRADLKANAKDLHGFLASNEKGRKEDFSALMGEIQKGLQEITKWQADVRGDTHALLKETRTMMEEYSDDIKEARAHWQSVKRGEGKKTPVGADHTIKKKIKRS